MGIAIIQRKIVQLAILTAAAVFLLSIAATQNVHSMGNVVPEVAIARARGVVPSVTR